VSDTIVIIGLGQVLRTDDAAGLAAVRYWLDEFPESAARPELRVELADMAGLNLLELLYDHHTAIIVDAMHADAPPGTVRILDADDLLAFGAGAGSAHGFGAAETLKIGFILEPDRMPGKLILIGLQIASVEIGEGLSRPVQEALPQAARVIQDQVVGLLGG
jgi:hydrogenase maturation protease